MTRIYSVLHRRVVGPFKSDFHSVNDILSSYALNGKDTADERDEGQVGDKGYGNVSPAGIF